MLKILDQDPYWRPFESAIQGRYDYANRKEYELTGGQPLSEWANGYLFYGLHK